MGTTGQSITLANSIIGVGILAMPFCFQQCGVLLATLILVFMGLVSRLCCYFLLKSALISRRRNFEFLAFHVFGPAGKMAVEVGIIGFLMGTCIAYFVVVGDLGPQIVSKMFNINQSDILRTSIMVIVSLVCVLPLGLLRNVDSLSNVSAATIGFYLCLVLKVIAEATSQLMSGEWRSVDMWKPSGVLQCVPIFSMALFCQTQLFEIFESLPSLSLEKMNVVTKNAINICTAVYFTLGLFGYIAFSSQNISGNILMSLSPTMGSDVIKLGFVMSLAFSFPLIIFPCRASLYSFLYRKVHPSHHDHIINHSIPEGTFRCITVVIIAVTLFISLLIPNIELVLGLVGSTIGVMICVIFPTACFINITFKNTNERVLAKGVLILGLIIMVLGTYANLEAAESKIDRFDDKYITQERIDKIVEDFFESKRLEKSDDGEAKPLVKNDPKKQDDIDNISKNIAKDSEVQPPNPVPPESQSNEKIPNIEAKEMKGEQKLKEMLPDLNKKFKDEDKVAESHPKNLNKGVELIPLPEANGNNGNVEKLKEAKPVSNEDKIDIMKKQQLIDTIKQHGEEQKELMKEQKEILDEIKKTKEELKQNKKEADSNEAKKIAVESIQKIANMAIQSLSGVTDKPIEPEKVDKKSEPLEKIANEAVQEIAKKAVETIEAIKEIDEKPKEQLIPKANINLQANVNQQPLQNANVYNNVHIGNIQELPKVNVNAINNNVIPNNIPTNINPASNIGNGQPDANNNGPALNSLKQINNLEIMKNYIDRDQKLQQLNQILNQNQDTQNNVKLNAHSHSLDEPQSYKHGEDIQKRIIESNHVNNGGIQNVPIPLTMNGNSQAKQMPVANNKVETNPKPNHEINSNNLNVQNNVNLMNNGQRKKPENDLVRQKREVVDCTEKTLLKAEDKQICETLVSNKIEPGSQEILPKIGLNSDLSRKVPIDTIVLRSLKSYDENKNER